MTRMEDWKMAEKVGKLKPVAEGADSEVYSLTRHGNKKPSSVVKIYDKGGFKIIAAEKRRGVLEEYYTDTLKASRILEKDPNPLRQSIHINGRTFPIKYKILPQGEVMLDEAARGYDFDGSEKAQKALYGQEFFKGLNMESLLLRTKMPPDKKQSLFINDITLYENIVAMTRELFTELSRLIGVKFTYASMNIKPFMEVKEGCLSIIITDLASSLSDYYEKSPKFKTLANNKTR